MLAANSQVALQAAAGARSARWQPGPSPATDPIARPPARPPFAHPPPQCAASPVPILLGFVCQYSVLPLLAVAISRVLQLSPAFSVGLILLGCCPGGQVGSPRLCALPAANA